MSLHMQTLGLSEGQLAAVSEVASGLGIRIDEGGLPVRCAKSWLL